MSCLNKKAFLFTASAALSGLLASASVPAAPPTSELFRVPRESGESCGSFLCGKNTDEQWGLVAAGSSAAEVGISAQKRAESTFEWGGKEEGSDVSDDEYYTTPEFDVSVEQKNGYLKLVELCLASRYQEPVSRFFHNLKDYEGDEYYSTTLNYVMEFVRDDSLYFIISVDWNSEVDNLLGYVEAVLRYNFSLDTELPDLDHYPDYASVSFEGVFSEVDLALRAQNLQLGFIDTESDEYVFVVHRVADKDAVQVAVGLIGYDYKEVKDFEFIADY